MRHCYVIRVFTVGQAGGNALGVIPDATGLGSSDMQAIATDLGFSETVFMKWEAATAPSLRIFTPAAEMPFAGHPLVGTAWVLNEMGPGADMVTIQIGEVRIRIDDGMVWVMPPPIDQPVRAAPIEEARQLGIPAIGAWHVEVPSDYLLVEVSTEEELAGVVPVPALAEAAHGLYVFHGRAPVRSRFFAPRLGVPEDPATGSAAVALGALLRSQGMETGSVQIIQGLPGSFSDLRLNWDGLAMELGGTVVKNEVRVLDV
ncbi:MAG: PhzF family phenazine biosynthesis protein [Acidimicrobiia bacterium]